MNHGWKRSNAGRPSVVEALVISLLKGEATAAEAARRHGLKLAEVEDWRDRFLFGAGERAARAAERR
jgi:hypothetical protein